MRECSRSRSLVIGKVHGLLWSSTKGNVAGCRDHMVPVTAVMHSKQSSIGTLTLHVKMYKIVLLSSVARVPTAAG